MFKDYNKSDYSKRNRPIKENKRHNIEDDKNKGLSRRNFLKVSVALAASWGIGKFALDSFDDVENEKIAGNDSKEPNQEQKITQQQLEIEKDDRDIVGNTIEEQLAKSEKVTLNIETKRALRQKWKQSYSKRPDDCSKEDKLTGKNHLGLLGSMERMQPWIEDIKSEFLRIGVPEKFAYLAIPESHFDVNDYSRASAKGPYQFTVGTAKAFGLMVENGVDQRCDPIESAIACAKHLKYSYGRFNDDWDLAFADYNGGFTNAYAKFCHKKEDRNYTDYLAWREGRINNFISKEHFEHKVKKSDKNLTKIARFYGITVEAIMEINSLKDDGIRIGQELKIPATTSVKMFKLRDSLENLNYPEKFYAILDVIEEEDLQTRFPSLSAQFEIAKVPKVSTQEFSYTVKKRQGLFAISRILRARFALTDSKANLSILQIQKAIQDQNKIFSPKSIRPGQSLTVNLPIEGGSSLFSLAEEKNLSLTRVLELNPSIFSSKQILPSGFQIRLPK